MMSKTCNASSLVCVALIVGSSNSAADMPLFENHDIANIGNNLGQTSLVDVDSDGDLDFITGEQNGLGTPFAAKKGICFARLSKMNS